MTVIPGSLPAELARRLVVGLEGPWPTAGEWGWLHKWQPHGVILFSRNVQNFSQLKQLCAALKDAVPALQIMADHEGGPVSQMAAAVGRPPVAYALGVLDDVDLTFRVHAETGRRLLAAGVDWALAPCADVLSEMRNPVIGARSFGSDPALVSRHVVAAVKGLRSSGISCCLKHWPGHGGSSADSHLEAAVVEISDADEQPFRAGLAAGAEAVMPGHLLVGNGLWPATLSQSFLDGTRHRLAQSEPGFMLMADDVSMGALREPMSRLGVTIAHDSPQGMVAVEALPLSWFQILAQAGCDYFLIRNIPWLAFAADPIPPAEFPEYSGDSPVKLPLENAPYSETIQPAFKDFRGKLDKVAILDLARHDRWQVAGGMTADHWALWDQIWSARFASVVKMESLAEPMAHEDEIFWLVVMNHRPMPADWIQSAWAKDLHYRLAPTGNCLVMGHPSLAGELVAFLNEGWTVTPSYDISCDLLGPS